MTDEVNATLDKAEAPPRKGLLMIGFGRKPSGLSRMQTYKPPPRRLDLRTAPHDVLRRHGLPLRPDPLTQPQLAWLWKRVFARPVKFTEAKLAIDPIMSARDPFNRKDSNFGQTGWGGIIRLMTQEPGSDYTQPATMVFAEWVIPEVLGVAPNGPNLTVGFWVGLDGAPGLGLESGAGEQVLQAGVAATIDPGWFGTDLTWWAWTEWHTKEFQDPAAKITNFPVKAGDTIFVVVCAPQPDFGFISMLNVTRGRATSVGINARPGITSRGASAEWIVESPPQSPHLPIFAPVTFTNCTAGSLQHGLIDLTGGFPTDIRTPPSSGSPFGTPLTKAHIVSPSIAVVEQLATDWF